MRRSKYEAATNRGPSSAVKLEIAPMLDVTFLLLVFFLCVVRFKTLEGRFDTFLPNDGRPTSEESTEMPIEVRIRTFAEGSTVTVGRQIVERIPSAATGRVDEIRLPQLGAEVARLSARLPETPVLIDPDPRVPNGHVVAVLDTLMEHEITNVRFTAPTKPALRRHQPTE